MLSVRFNIYLFIGGIISLLTGCIAEYELEADRSAGILVINGRITNQEGPHYVTLLRTTEKNQVAIPALEEAEVELIDNYGNTYPFFQELPGQFILPKGSVSIYPGESYGIRVYQNDQVYESTLVKMPAKSASDSIAYRLEDLVSLNAIGDPITSRMYNVYLTSDMGFNDIDRYYKWEVREIYSFFPRGTSGTCYRDLQPDPQRINIHTAEAGARFKVTDILITSRLYNDAFKLKYYTEVDQFAISRQEFDYWNKVQKGIEQQGSIFNIPPGRIIGNMKNISNPDEVVYGFFSAALQSTTRILVDVDSFNEQPTIICKPLFSTFELPNFCLCRNDVPKPDFF